MKLSFVVILGSLAVLGTVTLCAALFDESAYLVCLATSQSAFAPAQEFPVAYSFSEWIGNAQLTHIFGKLFESLAIDTLVRNILHSYRLFVSRLTDLSEAWCFYALTHLATLADGALKRDEALQNYGAYSPNGYSIAIRLSLAGVFGACASLTVPTPDGTLLAQAFVLLAIALSWVAVRNFHRFGS